MDIKRILVPVEFSERCGAALSYAADLATQVGAAIDVVHVWEPPAYVSPDMMVTLAEEAGQRTVAELARSEISREMNQMLKDLQARDDLELKTRLEVGPVPRTLLRLAESGEYDLIVLATHGRTGLPRIVLGSVSEQLVRLSPIPVLTVHAQR